MLRGGARSGRLSICVILAIYHVCPWRCDANPLLARLLMKPKTNNDNKNHNNNNDLEQIIHRGGCIEAKVFKKQASILQKEIQQWKHQYDVAASELAKEQAHSKRLSELKEDLLNEMAKLSSTMSKELFTARDELAQAKATLQTNEQTWKELHDKLQDAVHIKDALADRRVRETENLWKAELDLVKAKLQMDIETTKQHAQEQCREEFQQTLDALYVNGIGESTMDLADGNTTTSSSVSGNAVERVKHKILQEENTKLLKQMQDTRVLVDLLEGKYQLKFQEKEQQLRDQFADTLQDRAQEICTHKLSTVQETCERELNKALEMCSQDTMVKLQEAKQQMDYQIHQIQQENLEQLHKIKEDHGNQLTKVKEDHSQQMAVVAQEHSQQLSNLESECATNISDLKEEYWKFQETWESQIFSLHQTVAAGEEQRFFLERELQTREQMQAQHNHTCQLEITALQRQLQDLQVQHNTTVQAWNDSLQAKSLLQETIDSLQKNMTTVQQRTLDIQANLQTEIRQSFQSRETCQLTVQQCQHQLSELSFQLDRRQNETRYWHTAFLERSLFNATHAQESLEEWTGQVRDTLFYGVRQYCHHVAEVLRVHVGSPGLVWYRQHGRPLVDPVWKLWQEQYNTHLQRHVDHVWMTLHEQYVIHVSPHLQNLQRSLISHGQRLAMRIDSIFQTILTQVEQIYGPQLCQWLQTCQFLADTNNDHKKLWEDSFLCRNPKQTFLQVLYGTAIVLVVLWRKIWIRLFFSVSKRVIVGIVVVTAKSLWFLCPLRFLIPAKKKKNNNSGIATKTKSKTISIQISA